VDEEQPRLDRPGLAGLPNLARIAGLLQFADLLDDLRFADLAHDVTPVRSPVVRDPDGDAAVPDRRLPGGPASVDRDGAVSSVVSFAPVRAHPNAVIATRLTCCSNVDE
jgi:hypothetical protein